MAVRSTIGAVVFRMPFSDRLPTIVKTVLDSGTKPLPSDISGPVDRPLSPKEKIHNRLIDKRLAESPLAMHSGPGPSGSPINPIFEEDKTIRDTESVTSKKTVMQKYLDEQNAKFDDLINKNLSEVLKQQSQFQEDAGWRELVFNLALARNSAEVSSNLGLLVLRATRSAYQWIPFVESPTVSPEDGVYRESSLRDPSNDVIRTGPLSLEPISLESMDYDDKVRLLRQLQRDLGMENESDMTDFMQKLSLDKDTPLVDKIQILIILLIRLAFTGLKLFIPLCTVLYTKFKNNELMVLNNRNFNRVLNTIIQMMVTMGERFDHENNNTNEVGIQTIDFFDNGGPTPGGDSWAATVARYTMSRWTADSLDNTDFTNDPRYTQYFTEKRKMTIEDEDTFLRGEHPSVFQVAQQFAHEMG